MQLSDTKIRKAKATDKTQKMTDGKGLFLEITPAGSKLWRYRYRIDGKEGLFAIGDYGQTTNTESRAYSLEGARVARQEARNLVKQGVHPVRQRKRLETIKKAARSNTFKIQAEQWLEQKRPNWGASYYTQISNSLTAYVYPKVGDRPLETIEPTDMLEVIEALDARGTPKLAKYVNQWCGQVFKRGMRRRLCKSNPCDGLAADIEVPPVKHYRHLTDAEIPQLIEKMGAFQGRIETVYALRLLMLTFVRIGELRLAQWPEFDFDKKLWRIPAERMKGKTGNRREHIVPLSHQALILLRELRHLTGNRPYVFPGAHPAKPISGHTCATALRVYMGVKDFSPHGFRATASTWLHESGKHRTEVIERQLAHLDRNQTRASYNAAQYLPERKKLMQAWADHIDSLCGSHVMTLSA